MKTKKAFTLIELLVVIAIIGLLLAIIVPALRRAKEYGMRVLCSNNLKSIGTANQVYANEYKGAYVPLCYKTSPTSAWRVDWIRNDGFRAILDVESLRSSEEPRYYGIPRKLMCPADKISKNLANVSSQGVLTSYAMNSTEWGGFDYINNPSYNLYIGHTIRTMTLPAERLAFIDGIDWWTHWYSADPARGWNLAGQLSIDEYKSQYNLHGPVIYRHSEGANVAFYDGHVESFRKEDLFVREDYEKKPQRPGMWVMNLPLFYERNPGSK
ncbi:MAG TPA: prepilin-type N-terminal cleavage/methylation domain-containing protein [Anaerohalosphaeraceae bacterium]|nr:prepilin-type N-terminal cleavage/methylation domain-containing protein [Anaerohalosphaeraceae bacterium]